MGQYISIENYMRTQGISLREFSNRCGIAPSTMSRFLSGKTDIQKSNIDKILKVTGMSYEECFKEGLNEDKEN
jgi:transcriptional regulator with XRE-family HTH domain